MVYFTIGTKAEAGFITADPNTVSADPLGVDEMESAKSSSQPAETPIPPAYKNPQAETAPTSGMSSPSTVTSISSGGAAYADLSAPLIDLPCPLIARLGPESPVWLPPPFSSGVFRPPRFVGLISAQSMALLFHQNHYYCMDT